MNFATLQHSVFLQALGSAILNSLWQVFIIWLIYETVNAAYKTASAKFKNNLGTLLLFVSFTWFLTNFISKLFYAEKIIPAASAQVDNSVIHAIAPVPLAQTILSYAVNSLPYLSVAYIFLLFFLMAKLLAAYRYVYFIANKRLIAPPLELQIFADNVSSQMGIMKKIGVWISHSIDVPATIGFIKPVILIPVASMNNLSASQLEAIILHELSHIKRNDYLINIIISVIETILFFNPFVLLLSKSIKRERENCCDDFVLQYRYDPHSYASALLCLEQSRRNNLQLAIGAVSGKKQLLSRIKRITNCHVVSKQFNYGQKLLALFLVTGIICSIAWLSPEKKSTQARTIKKQLSSMVNTKPSDKTFSLAYKKIKDSEKSNSKNHQKIQSFTLAENNTENIPNENFSFPKIENDDSQNLLPAKVAQDFKTFAGLKQPNLFNGVDVKFPSTINIPNFPFQNMNFKVDLSNINLEKLNENLKLAYKEINALNWGKIQNDIYNNLSKLNTDTQLKDKNNYFKENALAILSTLKAMQNQQSASLESSPRLRSRAFLRDSLHNKKLALIVENAEEVQQAYSNWQDDKNGSSNYYFTSPYNTNDGYGYGEVKSECPTKKVMHLNSARKNIKIIISQTPPGSQNFKESNSFQYFFNESAKTSKPENVVSIDVSETH